MLIDIYYIGTSEYANMEALIIIPKHFYNLNHRSHYWHGN